MKMIFFALWGLSLLLMLAAAAQLWRAFVRKKEEITRALAKSLGLLFVSIFCVRLAVGLYLVPFRFNNRPEVILIELKATPN